MQVPATVSTINDRQAHREIMFKNVVMRIVIDIRDRKKKPKLSDFLNVYRKKKDQPNAKEEFQKKFLLLYAGEEADDNGEDEKFDKLMSYFDRCLKQLNQQQQAVSHLVKRVNNLLERREKKEKAIYAHVLGSGQSDSGKSDGDYPKFVAPKRKTAPKASEKLQSKEKHRHQSSGSESEGEKRAKER